MSNILLVDDNVRFRQALSDVLLTYFPLIDVDEAGDVTEALSKVDYLRPNIIFMDIQLPGENELELSKAIKQAHNDIVIVILTANDVQEHPQKAFRNGADYYISKGNDFFIEEILARVEEVMDSRSPN